MRLICNQKVVGSSPTGTSNAWPRHDRVHQLPGCQLRGGGGDSVLYKARTKATLLQIQNSLVVSLGSAKIQNVLSARVDRVVIVLPLRHKASACSRSLG